MTPPRGALFAELLATPDVVEHCELHSPRVGFTALHGGLEATTFEIAREAAVLSGASFYAVVQPPDLRWHVPSSQFVCSVSPKLRAFCDHVELIISLHGYGGVPEWPNRWTTVLIGGQNRPLAQRIAAACRYELEHYDFVDDLDAIPARYRGVHDANPVNAPTMGGAQLELPPRIRGNSPVWVGSARDDRGFVAHTATLVEVLADIARTLTQPE